MNTCVELPKNENVASKVLMDMYKVNQDYIQRLNEIGNLHKLVCRLIHNDKNITGLYSLIQTNLHAVNKWLDDLEQWQGMIDQAELKGSLDSLACSIYDDYVFYEADAQHFENIAVIAIQEAEKIKSILEHSCSYEMVKQLIATIKRQASQFKADLCAETDSLPELYPSVLKGA